MDGLDFYLYAADDCNPEECFKFFGCGKLTPNSKSVVVSTGNLDPNVTYYIRRKVKITSEGDFSNENSKTLLVKKIQQLLNNLTENINQGKDAGEGIGTTEFNPESYKDE